MKVADKINYLIQEKDLTKREFAQKLLSLDPKLDATGKSPSESTIYGYLNGGRELKVELIPYIADVLNVNEQDLFSFDIEYANSYNYKKSKEVREIIELLQYAPSSIIEHIQIQLQKYKKLHDETKKNI